MAPPAETPAVSGGSSTEMARPIVYGPAGSTYVWSARLALAEKGAAHELVDIGPYGAARQEPHLSRHPFGKVPAFEHDGFQLYETQAILRYIDEGFPVAPLQPTDLHRFSRMNQIMGIVDAYLWPSVAPLIFTRVIAPRRGLPADEGAATAALPQARLCLAEIARLQGEEPFLAGERITLADLMVIPLLAYFVRQPEGAAALAEHPALPAWIGRIEQRQSYQVTKPPGF
jgi:glutathione S-transferase